MERPGILLQDLRVENELTQKDLAAKLGITQQHLSDIERGRRGVSLLLAVDLERMGWGTARGWLHADADFRLSEYRKLTAVITQADAESRAEQLHKGRTAWRSSITLQP